MRSANGMGKPSDAPNFKALLAEWNRKLAESGFKDVEEMKHGRLQLKKTGTVTRFEQSDPLTRSAKARYFELIGDRIQETTFTDPIDRQILTLYFEGYTQVQIQRELPERLHRSTIYKRLYSWLKKWGLK